MAKVHDPNFVALVEQSRSKILECEIDEFCRMMNDGDDLLVVDVRESNEIVAGHLKGALHMAKGIIERDIAKQGLDQDHRIVLYCGGGFRSALAADNLRKMGWSNVYSLWGGWRAIKSAELEIVIPQDE